MSEADQPDRPDHAGNLRMDKAFEDFIFTLNVDPDVAELYDGEEFATLFAVLCRGSATYVRQWVERREAMGIDDGDLAQFVLHADDLEDPERAADPKAVMATLCRLYFEALADNVLAMLDIDPDKFWGAGGGDDDGDEHSH